MSHHHQHLSRRSFVQFSALSLYLPTAFANQTPVALALSMNRTARFRALSQRSAKAYVQLLLNVLPDATKNTIASTQRLMLSGLDELALGNYSAEVAQHIATIRTEATTLTTLVTTAPKREMLVAVSAQADKLNEQASKTTELIANQNKSGNAKIVAIADKQRMLTQRLAKNYFMQAANLNSQPIRQQLASDRAEFKAGLAMLKNAPISTTSIRNDIDLCEAQWFLFETSIDKPRSRPFVMDDVAVSSERLLDITSSLSGHYERALKDIV
jgi:Type IV pili methyl-accepting chemotaxis transducer N-term